MAILGGAGAELQLLDANKYDGEIQPTGSGGQLSISTSLPGPLIGNGAASYKCVCSTSKARSGFKWRGWTNPSGGTYQFGGFIRYHPVTTPNFDVSLFTCGADGFWGDKALIYDKLSNGSPVVHLVGENNAGSPLSIVSVSAGGRPTPTYPTFTVSGSTGPLANGDWVYLNNATIVNYFGWAKVSAVTATTFDCVGLSYTGTATGQAHCTREINSANAFTITEDATIGFIIEEDSAAPYQVRVYYFNGTNWSAKQSGNAAQAPAAQAYIYGGEDLPNSVNHNYDIYYDNLWAQDTSGTVNNVLSQSSYWDTVLEGIPNAQGTYNEYYDQAGPTICSTAGNCQTLVNDAIPPNTTNYVQLNLASPPATNRQGFSTNSLKVGPNDTVGAVKLATYRCSVTGSNGNLNLRCGIRDAGTDRWVNAGTVAGADSVFRWHGGGTDSNYQAVWDTDSAGNAWTPASMKAAEVMHESVLTPVNINIRVSALYKIVMYKPGATGFAHSQVMQF